MHLSRTRILAGSLVPVAAALAASGPFAGADTATLHAASVKNLWATVNICDTKNHPDAIGIRGHAPGRQTRANIWMRFLVQYQKNGGWAFVQKNGSPLSTGWRKIGAATYPEWRESGATFPFDLKPGQGYLLRGLVRFEWRLHGNVIRHEEAITAAGHSEASGGDPKGYSAATCFIARGISADRSLSPRRPRATPADRSAAHRPRSTRTAARPPAGPTGQAGATPATSAP